MLNKFFLISIFFLFACISQIFAQKQQEERKFTGKLDTVHVVGPSIIFVHDSAIYIQQDTILYLPDSISFQYKRTQDEEPDELIDTLKQKLSKNRITDRIKDFLFKDPPTEAEKRAQRELAKEKRSGKRYKDNQGKIIGNIIIKRLEPFGTDIEDTTIQVDKWYINAANRLHLLTWENVVRNNLIFKQGDRVDPLKIADSERYLRTLPNIKDARIYLKPSKIEKDVVDVLVITKDVWSITATGQVRRINAADLGIRERNLLGSGHELNNTITFDTRENPQVGYIGNYRIPNIKRTFTVGEFNFAYSEPIRMWEVNLYRNFITPDVMTAGGANVSNRRIVQENPVTDTSIIQFPIHYSKQDFWFGQAFQYTSDTVGRPKLVVAGRYLRYNFSDRPEVREDTNRLYIDRSMILGSISLNQRQYQTNNLIFGYGITEDIPSGHLLSLTFGREYNQFNRRTYVGLSFAQGNYVGKLGYVRGDIAFGGYMHSKRFEEGLLQTKINYYSHLLRVKKFYVRQFININYMQGINRLEQQRLTLSDDIGIRGFKNRELLGTKKMTINTETAFFTPYYILGFRFVLFAFADIGAIADTQSILKSKFYQGYGIGIRVRNENLTFNTFQLRIGFYPVRIPGSSFISLDVASRPRLYIEDFVPNEPTPLDFYYLE